MSTDTDDPRRWLSTRDVTRRLRVGHGKVLLWIRRGELRAIDIGSGSAPQFRICPAALDNFLATREITTED